MKSPINKTVLKHSKLVPPGLDHSWLVLCPYMASLSKLPLESAVLVVEWMKKLRKK